jgi:hypothetical protein
MGKCGGYIPSERYFRDRMLYTEKKFSRIKIYYPSGLFEGGQMILTCYMKYYHEQVALHFSKIPDWSYLKLTSILLSSCLT